MDAHFTSGPLNNDLLWLSGSHRGDYYFQNPDRDDGILRIRRGDQDFWRHLKSHPIPENVMEFITLAGFGGIVQCGNRRLDRALISALVERWRPETHTFHLPIGETTITLQDVNILWGLPIEGNVVSGVELNLNNSQIIELFENLVGEELPLEAVNGYKINLPFILTKIKTDLPENPTRLQSIQRARLIIFFLIGATLFPDSASNWVHINYLSHLEDLNNCGQLSWGSAVLACLYKHLCKVTDISRIDISGPVFLLQLWAWERFTGFAPEAVNAIDFQKPYGARWRSPLTYVRTSSHVLSVYRSLLHSLTEDKFNWRPYENVFHLLPGICMSGQASWRSETYLIFWEIVEPHLPSRVMRQFRMFQPIPVNTLFGEEEHRRIHKISHTGGRNVSWLQKHNQYILSWIGRHNNIVTTEITDSCVASPEYMQWYLPRTILYTIDPRHHQQNQRGFPNDGGTLQMTWDIVSQIYQRTGEEFIRDMASQAMGYGHVQHHMGYYPTHMSQDPVGYQVPLVPQSIRRTDRRRNRRQPQAQNVEAEAEAEAEPEPEPVINSPHMSSMDRSSSYHPSSPSQNFGEVGTSSQHFSQFGTQNYEDAGPSSYNPLQNFNEFQEPDFSQDFFSPSLLTPFYPPLDTPPTPAFRHLPDMRPPRDQSLSLEFDLNTTMDYTNEDNDDNENIATRRGRRQIRRPGCGTD